MSKYQIGTVVEARSVIVDHDQHGNPYIHAVPGTLGVVVGLPDEWPTVAWGPQGHGTCDVPPDSIEAYRGSVVKVTDSSQY